MELSSKRIWNSVYLKTFMVHALLCIVILLASTTCVAQQEQFSALSTFPDAPSNSTSGGIVAPEDDLLRTEPSIDVGHIPRPSKMLPKYFIEPRVKAPEGHRFQWREAVNQSFVFLSVQHGLRAVQPKTRGEFGGAFWGDYAASVQGIRGWGDGDGPWTNYILHPGEGGIASFIYIQNSPTARRLEFDAGSGDYWRSRLKGMAFAAVYSTQFEIGLYSEATIGNVGKKPGTAGLVDLVMTPVGGFAFTVIEDAVDRHVIQKLEHNRSSLARKRLYRMILNPERSIANLLRGKTPWHRDTRPMPRE